LYNKFIYKEEKIYIIKYEISYYDNYDGKIIKIKGIIIYIITLMTKKKKAKKGKHHHLRWLFLQIFAYEKDEKNHCSWISTLSLPCTSLDPNHGYPLTYFLLNSTTLEANRVLVCVWIGEWMCEDLREWM